MRKEMYVGLAIVLMLVACNVFAATTVTEKLTDSNIRSGGTTTIVVDAENKKDTTVKGYFEVVPDSPQVRVETTTDRVFDVGKQETTGEKRFAVTASASSLEQKFQLNVYFKDATTHEVLGQDKVVLTVRGG